MENGSKILSSDGLWYTQKQNPLLWADYEATKMRLGIPGTPQKVVISLGPTEPTPYSYHLEITERAVEPIEDQYEMQFG